MDQRIQVDLDDGSSLVLVRDDNQLRAQPREEDEESKIRFDQLNEMLKVQEIKDRADDLLKLQSPDRNRQLSDFILQTIQGLSAQDIMMENKVYAYKLAGSKVYDWLAKQKMKKSSTKLSIKLKIILDFTIINQFTECQLTKRLRDVYLASNTALTLDILASCDEQTKAFILRAATTDYEKVNALYLQYVAKPRTLSVEEELKDLDKMRVHVATLIGKLQHQG